MTDFESGYNYFSSNAGAYASGQLAGMTATEQAEYIKSVEMELDALKEAINAFKDSGKDISYLKGDVAEFFAAGTYNVNAAKAGSVNRAFVPRSNDLGSADVSTSWGQDYGLKYYKNAEESIKQQSKTIFERFKEYQASGGKKTYEEYLESSGYSPDTNPHSELYYGQKRLIPADQFDQAIEALKRKIAKEEVIRPELAEKYRHTLEMLCKKIEDGDGVSGIELTEEDSRRIASLAKEGLFDPVEEGMGLDPFTEFKFVLQDAFQAGLTSAVITMVLKTAPELYKAFVFLVETGEIDAEHMRNIGVAAISGAGEGFLNGAFTAAIMSCCRLGLLGDSVKNLKPGVVALACTLILETTKDAFRLASGRLSKHEMINNMIRNVYVGACSLALGAATQYLIRIPVLGYMLGSFLGSVIGGFTYQVGYNLAISFCIESGFTMFGLVEQDYKLPREVMESIGVEVFEYERFVFEKFEKVDFKPVTQNFEPFKPVKFTNDRGFEMIPLRRGVIGVGKIGYV